MVVSDTFIQVWVIFWLLAGGAALLYFSRRSPSEMAHIAKWTTLPSLFIIAWTLSGWSFKDNLLEGLSVATDIFIVLLHFSAIAIWLFKKASNMSDPRQQVLRFLAGLYVAGQILITPAIWFSLTLYVDRPYGREFLTGQIDNNHQYHIYVDSDAFSSDFITTRITFVPGFAPFIEKEIASSAIDGFYSRPLASSMVVDVNSEEVNTLYLKYHGEVVDQLGYKKN